MKNVNITSPSEINQQITETRGVEYADVIVYHEMAVQTSVRLNLIDQVHAQLSQLDVMIRRREFVMKEIFQHLVD